MNKDQEILRKITDADLMLDPGTWQNSNFEKHILAAQKETAIQVLLLSTKYEYHKHEDIWYDTEGKTYTSDDIYEIFNNQ